MAISMFILLYLAGVWKKQFQKINKKLHLNLSINFIKKTFLSSPNSIYDTRCWKCQNFCTMQISLKNLKIDHLKFAMSFSVLTEIPSIWFAVELRNLKLCHVTHYKIMSLVFVYSFSNYFHCGTLQIVSCTFIWNQFEISTKKVKPVL